MAASTFRKAFYYSLFITREFGNPANYAVAFIIGAVINIGMGHDIFHSVIPYIVPIFVQALSKASVNFTNKDINLLLALPSARKDPVFVINRHGHIIASTGKTTEFIKANKVSALHDIFNKEDVTTMLGTINKTAGKTNFELFEFYSHLASKWYQVQIKIDHELNHLLVWLDDITDKKELDQRLSIVKLFANEIVTSIKQVTKANDIYERLSLLILQDGYKGVFMTRKSKSGNLIGIASKIENDKYVKSEPVEIPKTSSAPVLDSRKYQRIVAETKTAGETQEAFDQAHQFDPRVKEFLGFEIKNFVNYHQGDVSIIGFNRERGIIKHDLSVMEVMVNTAISTVSLIDLSIINEDKFLQIITGLASASEYSDELTGRHILRVNEYSKLLAGHLNYSEEFMEYIGQVAALHDIGKVAMPEIIKLERKLTKPEFEQMTMHTIYGAQIVEQMTKQSTYTDTRLIMARNIALNHHQQWNGEGYPRLIDEKYNIVSLKSRKYEDYIKLKPLSGDEIPIEAMIVSLSDKYDALRSIRQYKPAFSHEKTTKILLNDDRTGTSGKDVFGPRLMELYLEIQQQFNDIFESMRDD